MSAFRKLDAEVRKAIIARLLFRKARWLDLSKRGVMVPSILLVGDRPANDAPNDPEYHYTPFSALHHSSLWVNLQLHNAGIPEEWLTWINSADNWGNPMRYDVLQHPWQQIILLGGNAKKWIDRAQPEVLVQAGTLHPQAWKRFHSKDRYPLLDLIQEARARLPDPNPIPGTRTPVHV
jgi:hypothetical protein